MSNTLAQAAQPGYPNPTRITRQHLLDGGVKGGEIMKYKIKYLELVIDELIMWCVTNNGGKRIMSRSEFEKSSKHPDAPKDYSYEEFVMDSISLDSN